MNYFGYKAFRYNAFGVACIVAALVCSGACSHETRASSVSPTSDAGQRLTGAAGQPNSPAQLGLPASAPPATTNLPQADPNVPDAQYVRLNSGYEIAALFYALSGMPPDYEALATAASQEYRSTNDQFRKRDLLQALKPKMDQQIAAYKDPHARYFTTNISNGLQLGHYDFNTASFPFNANLSPDSFHYFNDAPNYTFSFTNGAAFEKFPVKDEQRAKEIENLITRMQLNGEAEGYVFAQAADTAHNRVEMQIVRVILYGPEHRELGRY